MAAENTVFVWSGTDRNGRKSKGEVLATSAAIARVQLRKQGVVAKSVKKKSKPLFTFGAKKIRAADIAIFTRQLATMMKAGVPLVQAFDIVADGTDHEKMRELIMTVRTDVSSGTGLAGALEKHPAHFDELFCSLVASGENSGTLEVMLDRVATYKEKTEALKAKIKKALTYPIAVVVVAIVVTGILLVKVVPQFAETFQSFGSDLPGFTLFVLRISEWVQSWWFIMLLGFFAAGYAIFSGETPIKTLRRLDRRRRTQVTHHRLAVVHDAVIARFSQNPVYDLCGGGTAGGGAGIYRGCSR